MALLRLQCLKNLLCKSRSALSAFSPDFGKRELTALLLTEFADEFILCLCVGYKGIQCYNNRHIIFLYIFNMLFKIYDSPLKSLDVLLFKLPARYAAIIFQSPHSCNQNDCIRSKPCFPALNVKELFRSQICAEARLRNGNITHLKSHSGSAYTIAAMGNICKRTAMYDCRCML